MPVYEDWESVRLLLPLIDDALAPSDLRARVLLIDDGSQAPCPQDLVARSFRSIGQVAVLVLRRNLGHQRALCVGICSVSGIPEWARCEGVVVMDADGEDTAADIPRLIERFRESAGRVAVFARRLRRSEGAVFRVFYQLFRFLHRVFSGVPVQMGNFSILPMSAVSRLTVVAELWNHYAAACVHSRIPIVLVPTTRGRRLVGQSRMNFAGLVSHGLAAISVFGERIGARSLLAVVSIACALVVVAGIAVVAHLLTGMSLPRWSVLSVAVSALLLMQALLLSLVFSFLTLSARAAGHFIPARDYGWFVDRIDTIWGADEPV
jgi:glycosyltransferase involved in cell wall biosynthesis